MEKKCGQVGHKKKSFFLSPDPVPHRKKRFNKYKRSKTKHIISNRMLEFLSISLRDATA
jgi:hypothetical protein